MSVVKHVTVAIIVIALTQFDVLAQNASSPNNAPITAIFTEVRVEGRLLETIKTEIRRLVPGSHVRRITSGAESDQTLMVMYHPKGNFRAAINDYFRVLDPMPGIISTRTRYGVADRTPEKFPEDRLIGWMFIELEPSSSRAERLQSLKSRMAGDSNVLEVATLSSDYDLVVVYQFDGGSLVNLQSVGDRLHGIIGTAGVRSISDNRCP